MLMNEAEYTRLKEFYIEIENKLTVKDVECILQHLEIPISHKGHKSWQLHTGCHNTNSLDGGANLTFYKDNKKFTCFSKCGCSYNIFTLIKQRYELVGEPKSSLQCLKLVCDLCGFEFNYKVDETSDIYNWRADLSCYVSKEYTPQQEVTIFEDTILNQFPKLYHHSWVEQGVEKSSMAKFGIRYYLYRHQIIIPCRDILGNLIGVRVRNNILSPKYTTLRTIDEKDYSFPTSNFMYGVYENQENIRETKTAILVEAEKSVIKAESYLDKNITLGLYGHNFNRERLKQLLELNVEKVIIALDFDYEMCYNTDRKQTESFLKHKGDVMKIAKQLRGYIKDIYVVINRGNNSQHYKDCIFDFSKKECLKFLDEKVRVE